MEIGWLILGRVTAEVVRVAVCKRFMRPKEEIGKKVNCMFG